MKKVEVYIGDVKLDLFGDESIQLSQSITDVKAVGSVFSNFSQSFAVPASPTNNKVFNYYYNYQVQGGFDARYKAAGKIRINDTDFDTGFFKLNNVQLKNNKPHTYNITFFGALVNLKDIFGEDLISKLQLSAYTKQYNPSNVKLYMENGADINGITDALIAPLISVDDFMQLSSTNASSPIFWNNFKYALKLKAILKGIEDTYNLTFTGDFINSDTRFNSMYMLLHRDKGKAVLPEGEYTSPWNNLASETLWEGFANGMAGYTIPSGWVYNGGSWGPEEARSHEVALNLNVGTTDSFTLLLYRDLQLIWSNTYSGSTSYNDYLGGGELFDEGTYELKIRYTNPIQVLGTNFVFTLNILGDTPSQNYVILDSVLQSPYTFGSTFMFNIQDNIPEMKVLDFLTALFKMFNLIAYKDEENRIVLESLNDFYADGVERDWTKYLDSGNLTISPLVLYKEMAFEYEGLGTILADNHTKTFEIGWGTERYASGNKFEGTTYSVKLPFEHLKYERLYYDNGTSYLPSQVQYGWVADSKGDPYVGKPIVFCAEKINNVIIPLENDSYTLTTLGYYRPQNVNALGESIHFSQEFDEWDGTTVLTDTLFSAYYSDYISSIFNSSARLYRLSGKLPLIEIISYKLNDVIVIGNSRYRINKSDINLNTGRVNLELKNIV